MLTIRKATPHDAQKLCLHVRPEDINEVLAATGQSILPALQQALSRDGQHFTALNKQGDLLAVFGVADLNGFSRIGSPWLIGSQNIYKYRLSFLKTSKAYLPRLIEGYDYLVNMVDERNILSKKWLEWLGFTLYPATPYGPYDHMFHKFELNVNHANSTEI